MGGGHGLMNFEAVGGAGSLKWHFNWSGLNYCSSVITKHNTNYLDSATNLANATSGVDGDYEDVTQSGDSTATSPVVVDGNIKTGRTNLDMVGGEQHMVIGDGVDFNAFTAYYLIKVNDHDDHTNVVFLSGTSGAHDLYLQKTGGGNDNKWVHESNNQGLQTTSGTLALADGTSYVMVFTFTKDGGAVTYRAAAAADDIGDEISDTSVAGDHPMNIIALSSNVGANDGAPDHEWGEVLIYNVVHNAEAQKGIIKELKKEWGLAY